MIPEWFEVGVVTKDGLQKISPVVVFGKHCRIGGGTHECAYLRGDFCCMFLEDIFWPDQRPMRCDKCLEVCK